MLEMTKRTETMHKMRSFTLIALLLMLLAAGVAPRQAWAAKPPPLPPGVSTSYVPPQQTALARLAVGHVSINADGFFRINGTGLDAASVQRLKGTFDPLNAHLRGVSRAQRLIRGHAVPALRTSGCVYIPNWALEDYAWFVIIVGGVTATVGLFLDATIIGLPAGAVLGALGIWTGVEGTWFLWYVDKYYPDGGYICL